MEKNGEICKINRENDNFSLIIPININQSREIIRFVLFLNDSDNMLAITAENNFYLFRMDKIKLNL